MLKIGVAQIKNSIELSDNFKQIEKCLDIFQNTDVDLILFPECSLSGFSAKIGECTLDIMRSYLNELKVWSERYDKAMIIPTALREDRIYNTGFFLQGGRAEQFYKVGLTDSEKGFFSTPETYEKQIFTLKGQKFIPLICLEAQLDDDLYFERGTVDFILWPGYWGWEREDKWDALKSDGDENLVYANMSQWSVPLIQANFSYNDMGDDRSQGPHGLSVVVDKNNNLVYQASYEQQECFVVELDRNDITNCYQLESFA